MRGLRERLGLLHWATTDLIRKRLALVGGNIDAISGQDTINLNKAIYAKLRPGVQQLATISMRLQMHPYAAVMPNFVFRSILGEIEYNGPVQAGTAMPLVLMRNIAPKVGYLIGRTYVRSKAVYDSLLELDQGLVLPMSQPPPLLSIPPKVAPPPPPVQAHQSSVVRSSDHRDENLLLPTGAEARNRVRGQRRPIYPSNFD
jgi:hypothetical protein